MLKGVHLTLMIGPAVPAPVPKEVTESLTSVQVTSSTDRSGFQLSFHVGKNSPLLTTMLPAGYFDPIVTRVIIIVTVGGAPNVIMDGIITRQEVAPSNEPGQSTLTVTGEDLSVLMDIVEMPFMRFPAMPDVARVALILVKYVVFGIVPVTIPPIFIDVPIPIEEVPSQQGTDLAYVKQLASQNGYVFYVEPGTGLEHRLLGAGHTHPDPAAGAQHQHGRAHERRVVEFQPRWSGQEDHGDDDT